MPGTGEDAQRSDHEYCLNCEQETGDFVLVRDCPGHEPDAEEEA